MRRSRSSIQVWFLDDDLHKSSSYLTNDTLDKSIDGCYKALITSRMYFIGIRSQKFYDHFFSKEKIDETMQNFFIDWPLASKPTFQTYSSKLSKWCRKCNEHYQYIAKYLDILLSEYEFRHSKQHKLHKFIEWEQFSAPRLKIPNAGIQQIYIPWKCLKLKWRRKNLVEGYRLQYMNSFEKDVFEEFNGTMRDIPQFVVAYFKLDIAGMS